MKLYIEKIAGTERHIFHLCKDDGTPVLSGPAFGGTKHDIVKSLALYCLNRYIARA